MSSSRRIRRIQEQLYGNTQNDEAKVESPKIVREKKAAEAIEKIEIKPPISKRRKVGKFSTIANARRLEAEPLSQSSSSSQTTFSLGSAISSSLVGSPQKTESKVPSPTRQSSFAGTWSCNEKSKSGVSSSWSSPTKELSIRVRGTELSLDGLNNETNDDNMGNKDESEDYSSSKNKPSKKISGKKVTSLVPTSIRSLPSSYASDSDSSDDLLEFCRQAEANRKEKEENDDSLRYLSSRTKIINNPIALAKRESERGIPQKNERRKRARTVRKDSSDTAQSDADIWEDNSDNDGSISSEESSKPRNKHKARSRANRNGGSVAASKRMQENPWEEFDETEIAKLKPEFLHPKKEPSALEPLQLPHLPAADRPQTFDEVPASVNRYLYSYQREGIKFLHHLIISGKGAILGDDMGLGKTVQLISLLAALLKKKGTGYDAKMVHDRRKQIGKEMKNAQAERDIVLLGGSPIKRVEKQGYSNSSSISSPAAAPILVIVPASVRKNWQKELETWGHFGVTVYGAHKDDRDNLVEQCQSGFSEIMLVGNKMFSQKGDFAKIKSVPWKLVIVDEFHDYKNLQTGGWKSLYEIKQICKCPIVGLSGTPMPNNHRELWNLVHLVQPDLLGEWKEFNEEIVRPMQNARTKGASTEVIERGQEKQRYINELTKEFILQRKKTQLIELLNLTNKSEKVIFCELSDVQKVLYSHILSLPDFDSLKYSNAPCDCGINRPFFARYKRCTTRKEKVAFQRKYGSEIVKRKNCCYRFPKDTCDDVNVHPNAVIWKAQHEIDPSNEMGYVPCDRCPTCSLLPSLQKLHKVCSHPSLIQVEWQPDSSEDRASWQKKVDFAKIALTNEILTVLPGGGIYRQDRIVDDHIALSGKMKALDFCLTQYSGKRDRVLIFSYSTSTLDLIEKYVKGRGYSYLRLDGSTPTARREALIDKYQNDGSIFILLISTKAGGLGINLTAANKVIVYDVSWNPSYDEQAQDRAYRIGQKRNVEVIRLVSRGTIEELMYARQLYKIHLSTLTLGGDSGAQPARMFNGVAGDKNRKGELFGLENLLKFKDGSFMSEIWTASDGIDINNPREIIDEERVGQLLRGISLDQMNRLGDNERAEQREEVEEGSRSIQMKGEVDHRLFLSKENGNAALMNCNDGSDEVLDAEEDLVHAKCILESNKINDECLPDTERCDAHPSPVKSAMTRAAEESTTMLSSTEQINCSPNEMALNMLNEQYVGEASSEGGIKSGNCGVVVNEVRKETSPGSEAKASVSALNSKASHEDSISAYFNAKRASSIEEKSIEDISKYSSNEEKTDTFVDVPPENTATAKENPHSSNNVPMKDKSKPPKNPDSKSGRELNVSLMGVSTSRNAKQKKGNETDFLSLLRVPSYMKRKVAAKRDK